MAQIRFVDVWLRAPGAIPSHYRSVMVITEKWAEQRVLMRAYADSRDQTRPTIVLYGVELAIGPAGTDVNGPWGIHVQDQQNEGVAQGIKAQLEDAARRLAGSKGNPPRLLDEESTFDREPTANWGPGAPRILPKRPDPTNQPQVDYVSQVGAARVPQGGPAASYVAQQVAVHHAPAPAPNVAPSNPELRQTPMPRRARHQSAHQAGHHAGNQGGSHAGMVRTALGYSSGSGAQSAIVRLGLAPHVSAGLGWLVDRVVPSEFHIDSGERKALNALGERELTAKALGQLLDLADAVSFMEDLTRKLETYGLDLVEPGEPHGGEPTYRLRR